MSKIILIIVCSLLALFCLAYLLVSLIQRIFFGKRCDGSVSIVYPLPSEYSDLEVKKSYFENNKKTRFTTYEYRYKKSSKFKAVILLFHGIGNGHFYLLPLIEYLCKKDYLILTYDQYASGTSEGRVFDSMCSSSRDAKFALKYVEENYSLPLYVLGHSWGGYTSLISLNYSNRIEKCISVSGFNCESDILRVKKFTAPIRVLMRLRAFLRYGKDGLLKAEDILKTTDKKVLYLQGEKDNIVSPTFAGEKFKNICEGKSNIEIKIFKEKGHTPFVLNNAQDDQNKVMENFGFMGGVLVPMNLYVDYKKYSTPDLEVYKLISDFLDK